MFYIWGVENSKAVETPFYGQGCSTHTVECVSEKCWTFAVEHSAYDGSADGSGHTWKPYYFYWDGEMHEYVATLKLEDGKVELIEAYTNEPTDILSESTYGGFYMSAMIPEIATYP